MDRSEGVTEGCGKDIEECERERVLSKYSFPCYMNYTYSMHIH